MGYRLTAAAEGDVIAIWLAGASEFGEAQADAYHAGLAAAFAFLGTYPYAARERREIVPPVRCHLFMAHIIIYVVTPDSEALIVRVRHAREDWQGDPL